MDNVQEFPVRLLLYLFFRYVTIQTLKQRCEDKIMF